MNKNATRQLVPIMLPYSDAADPFERIGSGLICTYRKGEFDINIFNGAVGQIALLARNTDYQFID